MDKDFVLCPFNKLHIIPKLRIQYHIVKCKKHYPNTNKIVCPYDATEYISPECYTNHLYQCKKKKRLDVSEEFRKSQLEPVIHGDVSSQTFFPPEHAAATDEWSVESSDEDGEMTVDEQDILESKQKRSMLIKNACNFISLIPHSIGRGRVNEALREYLNNQSEQPKQPDVCHPLGLNSSRSNGNALSSDEESYADAVENSRLQSCSNLDDCKASNDVDDKATSASNKSSASDYSDNNGHEHRESKTSKYYRPSVSRGGHRPRCIGRGVGRGITLENQNITNSTPSKLDYILKQLVESQLSIDNSNHISSSSNNQNIHDSCQTNKSEIKEVKPKTESVIPSETCRSDEKLSSSPESLQKDQLSKNNLEVASSCNSINSMFQDDKICFTTKGNKNFKIANLQPSTSEGRVKMNLSKLKTNNTDCIATLQHVERKVPVKINLSKNSTNFEDVNECLNSDMIDRNQNDSDSLDYLNQIEGRSSPIYSVGRGTLLKTLFE